MKTTKVPNAKDFTKKVTGQIKYQETINIMFSFNGRIYYKGVKKKNRKEKRKETEKENKTQQYWNITKSKIKLGKWESKETKMLWREKSLNP